MENKDQRIDEGLKKIEAKLAELEQGKPGNYTFRTNCRYKNYNIKTLKLEDLVMLYTDLKVAEQGFAMAVAELGKDGVDTTELTAKIHEFTPADWKSDMLFLIKKCEWNQKVGELERKRGELEKLYSQEKKDNLRLEELLKDL